MISLGTEATTTTAEEVVDSQIMVTIETKTTVTMAIVETGMAATEATVTEMGAGLSVVAKIEMDLELVPTEKWSLIISYCMRN